MTIAATESTTSTRLPRLDWPFLIASVLATAVMIALVMIDGQPAAVALIVLGFALGIAFLKTEFSFTASWRRLIVRGQADGFLAGLLLIAIAATAVMPVANLVPGYGGAIAPIGPSLIIGAFVFGIGMQLGNGCGSGTLYTVGGGSGLECGQDRGRWDVGVVSHRVSPSSAVVMSRTVGHGYSVNGK